MITTHITGENWKTHESKEVTLVNPETNEIKAAFLNMVNQGLVNVNFVNEDSQSPVGTSTRYSHPYMINHNGDVDAFVYDDAHRQQSELFEQVA